MNETTTTNERGNKMKTAPTNPLEWTAGVNGAGYVVKYSASGPGYEARVFTTPFDLPRGWHAIIEFSSGSTRMMDVNGAGDNATAKAWVTKVVNEYS
jgi:hypothetical protein